MKAFYGFMSTVLALCSAYLMFFKKDIIVINPRDLNLILGFGVMLMAITFILFAFIEERNEEIEQLKNMFWYKKK